MKIEVLGIKPVLKQAFLVSVVAAFSSIVFMLMWNWHIADLICFPHINILESFSVLIFLGLFKRNSEEKITIEKVNKQLNKQAIVLIIGFILHCAKSIF